MVILYYRRVTLAFSLVYILELLSAQRGKSLSLR